MKVLKTLERILPLRVVVLAPPKGVSIRMQSGRNDLVDPTKDSSGNLIFDLTVRVRARDSDGGPNFLGPLTHGRPEERFLYVNSGTSAGQLDSCWTRRAKIHLRSITWNQIEEAIGRKAAVLETQFEGTGRDGGPSCASVPLIGGGWQLKTA